MVVFPGVQHSSLLIIWLERHKACLNLVSISLMKGKRYENYSGSIKCKICTL